MAPTFVSVVLSVASLGRYIRHVRHARIVWPPRVPPAVSLCVIALVSLGFAFFAVWGYMTEVRSRQKIRAERKLLLVNQEPHPRKAA